MNRRIATVLAVALVIISSFPFALTLLPQNASATTHFVGGSGVGNYTTIQAAVNASFPGDTVFVYNGTYLENIVISKPITLVGNSKESTEIDGRNLTSVVQVYSDSVTIKGFTISNSSHHWFVTHAGVLVYGAQGCQITGNILTENLIGVYLGESQNNVVMNNMISFSVAGVSMYKSDNDMVSDNTIIENGVGISISYSTNSNIAGNVMIENHVEFWGDLVEHWNTHSIDITNTVNGKPVYYWKDVNSELVPLGAGQVILANSQNVVVQNQNFDVGSISVQLGFTSGNIVRSNTFQPGNLHGIRAYRSDGDTFTENTFVSNWYAISVILSQNVVITGNNITGDYVTSDWQVGIRHTRGGNADIEGNSISGASIGVFLQYTNETTVLDNNISLNKVAGIRCQNCQNVTVFQNDIAENSIGIEVSSSIDSQVYHNLIVSNAIQSTDDGAANAWDNDYPSGGNYWSDYVGADVCSGPVQDICPDPDGIGDTPYVIDSDTMDRYPLISPLDTSKPQPPYDLQAFLSGYRLGNVTLRWALSPNDGNLSNVKGYHIYRNMTYDHEGLGYRLLVTLPNRTSEYTDRWVGEGNPNNYFYRICAVDFENNVSCARNQAGKYTRPLSKGPNLVSIPLIQMNESIENVLQTVEFDKAWTYDATENEWKWYMKFKPEKGELKEVNHLVGLWIDTTENSNLTVAGIIQASTHIPLRAGWNLVGYPSFGVTYSAADFRADLASTDIECFDPVAPPYFLRSMRDEEVFQTGHGYWTFLAVNDIWVIDSY